MIPAVLPYTLLIRWGAIAVLALLLAGAGFKCGHDRGTRKVEGLEHKLMVCGMDREALSDALNQVNAQASQAEADAEKARQAGLTAAHESSLEKEGMTQRIAGLEREAARLVNQSPQCKAQQEVESCVPFN